VIDKTFSSAIKPVSFQTHSSYPNDSARPSFVKLVPSSRRPLPSADQIYAKARKTGVLFEAQVASTMDGTHIPVTHVYVYVTCMHTCAYVRVYVRACRPRLAMRDRRLKIAGTTPTCASQKLGQVHDNK